MEITKEFVEENLEEIKKFIPPENKAEEKTVGIAIKNRWTGSIIFQSTKITWREAIAEAKIRADLTDADLTGADLTRADLTGADLTRADLTGANLTGADLTGANLTGADLTGANLTGADLTDANLTACLYYFGNGNKNFEALCKAIKTIKHRDGKFEDFNPKN